MKKSMVLLGLTVAMATSAMAADWCDPANVNGQVNTNGYDATNGFSGVIHGGAFAFGGATMFHDFFKAPASTNDYIDANNDGRAGFLGAPDFADQLAKSYPFSDSWWGFQYRAVGSGNGFNEFLNAQLCGWLPEEETSDGGLFNRHVWLTNGANPLPACMIHGAFSDVPANWFFQYTGEAGWYLTPGADGYGLCPIPSSDGTYSMLKSLWRDCNTNGIEEEGESMNTDIENPDDFTLYSTVAAWVPVGIISNRGTNVENVKFSELQYLFTTGRMPNGENLVACTRDVGSGTRNASMNSIGIDPSWARGDNLGHKNKDSLTELLGPEFQPTNRGGSSRMEGAVQNCRLAIGYTGLSGSSRSVKDSRDGKYELLNICKDVDAYGATGSTSYVRPSVSAVIENCNIEAGWQIGGSGSFIVRGDRHANRDMNDPQYNGATPPIANQNAADYLNNILDSIAAFNGSINNGECQISGDPCVLDADCTEEGDYCVLPYAMPGEYLARDFFLPAGLECGQDLTEPLTYNTNDTNQMLKNYILTTNDFGAGGEPREWGTVNPAGRTPVRASQSTELYTDGMGSSYCNWNGSSWGAFSSSTLSAAYAIHGNFNRDSVRNVLDANELVAAYYDPRGWQRSHGNIIPEILGDFDGDGSFTKNDLRYFADGLAMTTDANPVLDRKAGAIAIDNAIASLGKEYPWADPADRIIYAETACSDIYAEVIPVAANDMIVTGMGYEAGDFRGDVAGNNAVAGAYPAGHDGLINDADIDYVCESIGDWTNLDEAIYMDMSCDMNGDLDVTLADVEELVVNILDTQIGDANLDGVADAADLAIVQGEHACNDDASCGWADGDFNCDRIVDEQDEAFLITTLDVVDLYSMAPHGDTEYGIQIYPPSLVNNRPYTCEPRYDLAENKLEIGLSNVIADASGITVTATNTSDEVVSATVALDPAGDMLIATFSPALANAKIYTIDVTGSAVNDFQCEYVVLVGNLTNGGPQANAVNAFDKSLAIARLGGLITDENNGPHIDIARNGPSAGVINAFDKSLVISRLGDVAN